MTASTPPPIPDKPTPREPTAEMIEAIIAATPISAHGGFVFTYRQAEDMVRRALKATPEPEATWQLVTKDSPKKGEPFLAAIHHGQCGYLVVEATRIGPGIHHVAEDSCVGWRPGHEDPAFWRPLPAPPEQSA